MNAKTLSFTTFNLLNLNRPDAIMYGRPGPDAAGVAEKVEWTGRMLARAVADVIGFQELWHPEPLEAALKRGGLDTTHDLVVPPGCDGTSIVCAAAVRKGLQTAPAQWIESFPEGIRLESSGREDQAPPISVAVGGFSRPVLRLHLTPRDDAAPVHVFVCHLKSKRPTEIYREGWYNAARSLYKPHSQAIGSALSTIRRTAEALALRVILNGVMKNTRDAVAVLGDLNDGQESNTIDLITTQPKYLEPLSTGGSDVALYSGQALQQMRSLRDVYYTYIHEGQHGSLDHILVSEELYDQSRRRMWKFDGLDIFNDHLGRKEPGAVDHGIVRARFSLRRAAA